MAVYSDSCGDGGGWRCIVILVEMEEDGGV